MRTISLKDKKQLVLNSNIELGEQEGNGKGRYFVSRFIEPGIAHYEELGDILITKETLNKFIHTMVGAPVIIDHEDVTDKNVDKLRVGSVSKVWFDEFDGYFYCEGILTDPEAIDLIKNQGWNVSCAYSFVADETKKQHNGKDIDMEFTDGEFLHLAIVKNPRYEGANIVVNAQDEQKQDNIIENDNKGSIVMQVLNELKEFIKSVVSNEKEEEMTVKNEDKRKLIDEIGGILKDKVDDEIIRTVIKKCEELSYEPSEDDKADNKAKNEDDEDKEAKNKCKNEDEDKKEDDKKEDEKSENEDEKDKVTENEDDKEEKEDKKEVKNSMTDIVMGGTGKAEETKLYISRKERLEEGNKF